MPKDINENKELVALQHIMYDDTPENIAKDLNVQFD
jgi:hypothetical protein